MKPAARTEQIKEFFDGDSVQYLNNRYPTEPRTCDQLSYHVRRQYVLDMLGRTGSASRLLDIGCGPAVITADLVERQWKVTGIDLSSGMLAAAARISQPLPAGSVRFAGGVGTHLPFRDETFNTVLCIGVVSYIEDVPLLLREVHRVLRPGGQAIFQISNAASIAAVDTWMWNRIRRLMSTFRELDAHDRFRTSVQMYWHRPGAFDAMCQQAGLTPQEFRFFDFRPPLVVDRMSQRLALSVGRRLENIGGSSLATALAASYIVRVSRDGARS